MKKITFIFLLISISTFGQRNFPAINDFGGVYDVPEAENFIDITKTYKILVDVTQGEKNPTKDLNKAYELVARLHNLYALAGLPKGQLDVVVVIHFEATPTILSDEAFQFEFKEKNPNTDIINKLGENGVRFYVCGQSLRARKFVEYKKNPYIKVTHGALLALTYFQSEGYSLLKM